MAFSRRQVMTMKSTDMNQVVRISMKLLHRLIGEDIILKVHETPEPLPVMADVGQLEQVLMNLATNARDAMPDGGSLTIGTRRVSVNNLEHEGIPSGIYALTTVTDTGSGIPAEHLDKIFEPFFTTKESGKGTGLGLASVYGIMQQHAGAVRVESTPGTGTSFLLYLPLSERAGESLAENATTPVSGGTETLLIVEDDAPLRTIMRRVLAMHGYTILEAETGAAAVRICTENEGRIDLVLSDAVMPEMGGFEAWQIIHEQFPSIRFLFMSGYISDEGKRSAIVRLGLPYITKPFEPRQLLEIVRKELDRA
jgi:two-component system NtrC family sensor kinase